MATKAELQKQVAELKAMQARAEVLYQISRGLSAARDEHELLQVLAQPAREAGAFRATLLYIDLDGAGQPEWLELVASLEQDDTPAVPVGTRYYVPNFLSPTCGWTAHTGRYSSPILPQKHGRTKMPGIHTPRWVSRPR